MLGSKNTWIPVLEDVGIFLNVQQQLNVKAY